MKTRFVKLFTGLALLALFFLANPAMVPAQATNTNLAKQESTSNVTSTLTFNVTQGQDLIYHLVNVTDQGNNYLSVNNTDQYGNNIPDGNITTGDNIAFNYQSYGNNGTYDYVDGSVRGSQLLQDAQVQYYFVDPSVVLFQSDAGPPALYFVMPSQNFTQTAINYKASFASAVYTGHQFNISTYDTNNIGDVYLNVSWNTDTGIMTYYNYTQFDQNLNLYQEFVFSFQGSVNMANFMPYFAYHEPTMFYSLSKVQFGTSNKINFDTIPDTNGSGFIQQGQNAMVSLQTNLSMQDGPQYSGELATLTGQVEVGSPFGNNNNGGSSSGSTSGPTSGTTSGTNNGGGPSIMFIFPISSNAGWWSNLSLELSVGSNVPVFSQNSTTFTITINDHNNTATMVFNKVDGVLSYYNQQMNNFPLPDGTNGTFDLQFNLHTVYDMSKLYPYYAVSKGTQYKYHIDTLNVNGSSIIPADVGTFSQGQDFHIRLDSFSLMNGPSINTTFSTTSGQSHAYINYDIFHGMNNGPALFFPVIPVNSSTPILNFFTDVFGFVIGAQVVNNATTFGVQINNFNVDSQMTINHLNVYWDKSNGLLQSYDFSASNPANATQVIEMKLHYLGNSTGEVVYTSNSTTSTGSTSTISAPGFEFAFFFTGMIALVVISKKRRTN